MKKILIGLAVILAVVVGALFVVPPIIGNSVVKSKIIEAVKEATGRDLQIADVGLAVLPSVSVSISGLRLANAEGASAPEMVSLGRMDLDLQLFPLIGKEVIVDRLVISDLVASLEVNEAGVPNWAFEGAADDGEPEAAESGEGAPLAGLRLGDVRLENARLSYKDMTSGQTIVASDVNLAAALPNIAGKLSVTGGLTVNQKSIHVNLGVESLQALMTGQPAKLAAAIRSELIELQFDLDLAQRPQPAVDGNATITIGSVGALLAWLEQPLPADQPDPGPLKLAATFKTEGAKVLLEEAIVEGEALDLKANGSFESEGGVNKVTLMLESGVLDIDRYLPPPAPGTAAPEMEMKHGEMEGARREHPMKAIPDEPFDLTPLKQTEADITIAMAGIKAAGYEVGKLAFAAHLAGGKLQADLSELALYGGGVTGTLSLDGSGDALGVAADFKLDKVDLGALTAVAADGEAPMAGVASGSLTASAVGVSPRALVQDLKASLVFKLGKVDVKNAAAGTISGVDLAVDLPGLAQSPSVKGEVVYNKRKMTIDVGLDPLDKVLAGETFALTARVESKLLKLSYDGVVQQQPLPGLDGRFNFTSPSVGKLAAWLGQPLDPDQPDPGALKIDAVLKAEGATVVLEQAVIEGEALKAEASGSVDSSGEVMKVTLDVKAGMLDIDRYLPPPAPAQQAEAPAPEGGQRPANPLDAVPDEPIDLSVLQGAEADISIALDGLRAAGFELGQTQIGLNLAGGKLELEIGQLALYGGGIKGRIDLDGSSDVLSFASDLSVSSLAVGDLARAAGVDPAPLEGVMTATLKAKSQGKSPRALVAALSADLGLQMSDAGLAAMPDMAIGTLDVALAVPALDQATNGKVALTLNGKPLEANFTVDSPQKAMQGEVFGLQVAVTSELLKASIDGSVQQQPLPGLDGSVGLDVSSVGQLAAWLGQPLPDGQPDPGPLKIDANLTADGKKVGIKSASITGKAAEASASGSFDGTGEIILFDGKLDVAKLDLNAYLPPPSDEAAAPAAEEDGAKGWSEERIDVSPLRDYEGQVQVTLANVLYREVEVQNAAATVTLSGGVLKADVTKVQLSPGDVTAAAVVDGSGDAMGIDYRVALQGVESKPFLKSFADMDFLSGKLNFQAKGTARGANEKQIVESLNGDGNFAFLDGAVEGFDLAGTLRNLGQLGMASDGSTAKTDFSELSGSYTITDGLLRNGDLMMLAPLVRVTGAGQADLPPQTLDYNVEAELVASLEGQGGTDALAGLPIPVHVYGPWDNLAYDPDYATMLNAAILDPERLANLPADIAGQATNFGITLPGLGGTEGTGGGLLEGVLGGTTGGTESSGESGGLGGILGGAVGGLLGGGGSEQPAAEEGPAPTGEGPTPTVEGPAPTQQEEEPSIVPDASKLLKGLFN
ncbi:MAG: AsmA family protein [Kiloniellales bacterium]